MGRAHREPDCFVASHFTPPFSTYLAQLNQAARAAAGAAPCPPHPCPPVPPPRATISPAHFEPSDALRAKTGMPHIGDVPPPSAHAVSPASRAAGPTRAIAPGRLVDLLA